MNLILEAKTPEQGRILEYLQNNASNELAEKINHGVPIEQDGLKLLNLKTLDGFMEYACKEAMKLINPNTKTNQFVTVDGDIICGWAVHYFEEDSIIGKLYTEDGTEYQPPKPKTVVKHTPAPAIKVEPPKPVVKPQISMFDLMDTAEEVPTVSKLLEEETPSIEDSTPSIPVKQDKPASKGSPVYQSYMKVQNKYPDYVVAYRLGDFYEVFGKNAVKIAEELDLTLTSRDCGLDSRVAMIGFPYHASDVYFGKIAGKHNLVIADSDTNIRVFNACEEDEEIDEDLTYEDMRKFDGDITEPVDLPDDEQDDTSDMPEDDFMQHMDTEAVAIIYDMLGDMLDIQ
ncbi:MAG: hypothetical protein LUI60_01460 [Clostridia bacterium]|nr:hypothetical protein [Clostridia bacterium]